MPSSQPPSRSLNIIPTLEEGGEALPPEMRSEYPRAMYVRKAESASFEERWGRRDAGRDPVASEPRCAAINAATAQADLHARWPTRIERHAQLAACRDCRSLTYFDFIISSGGVESTPPPHETKKVRT